MKEGDVAPHFHGPDAVTFFFLRWPPSIHPLRWGPPFLLQLLFILPIERISETRGGKQKLRGRSRESKQVDAYIYIYI